MIQTCAYISGPMTGYDDFNYPLFGRCATNLRGAHPDWAIANPAEFHDGDQSLTRAEYFREDVEVLLSVNAVVLLDGWQQSQGAVFEVLLARQIGVETFYEYAEVPGIEWSLEPVDVAEIDLRLPDLIPHLAKAAPEDIVESAVLAAHFLVHGSRGADYGHPLDDFTKTATIWSAIFGHAVTAEQVALAMIGVKMSRLLNTPDHRDSIVDIAGYAETYDMVRAERDRRRAPWAAEEIA